MKLDELEALAREATPGPWSYHAKLSGSENHRGYYITAGSFHHAFAQPMDGDGKEGGANAAYIAAANPQAILKLCAVVRAAQEWAEVSGVMQIERLRTALSDIGAQ